MTSSTTESGGILAKVLIKRFENKIPNSYFKPLCDTTSSSTQKNRRYRISKCKNKHHTDICTIGICCRHFIRNQYEQMLPRKKRY